MASSVASMLPRLPKFEFIQPALAALTGYSMPCQPLACIAPTASAFRAGMEFIKGRHDHMIVTDSSNQFAGILTERDLLKIPMDQGAANNTTVADLMTPAAVVESAGASDSMWECIATMKRGDYHTLPILEEGEVRRVVSMRDICSELSLTLSKRFFMPVSDQSDVTIGDLLCDVSTPGLSSSLTPDATVADAVERMRKHNHGAVLVLGGAAAGGVPHIGMFSEREYLYNVLPYLGEGQRTPHEIRLSEVAQFSVDEIGASQRTMQRLGSEDLHWRPSHLTCVERTTPVRCALSLMLPTGLLYVPVLEDEKPADVVSLREIMLFLAQES